MITPLRLFPGPDETIQGVGLALREGRTSCAAVLERCFHQIDLWDERVRAWVFIDRAGAMHQARSLDEELKAGDSRGPLHGIPIGVKDIIDVAGMPTAAGFSPWRDRVARDDAPLVASLREAGAVILGKTVTTQFAWIDPPPTRNPWNLERTPGGSSSGSAAAVATGMCLGAIGTQTGGSITRPASYCGVCGYKPPFGAVSVEGVLPFAPSLDHPGPIARTVADLEIVARAIDVYSSVRDVLTSFEPEPEEGAEPPEPEAPTLYRLRGLFDEQAEPAMSLAYEAALTAFEKAGAIVEDRTPLLEFVHRSHRVIMATEAAAGHESRLAEHRNDYRPQIRGLVEEGLSVRAVDYVRAKGLRNRFESELHTRVFSTSPRSGPEVIALPAAPGPAPDPSTTGDPVFNSPWSFSGDPVVSIPIALSPDGMPLALQLVGRGVAGVEELFNVARWCQRVLLNADPARASDREA
jgi:aspartyl-tRNA(Asn)/glutamyl-tRNA(Gln) amidotransferase subunit A